MAQIVETTHQPTLPYASFQKLVFDIPVFHPLVDPVSGELDVRRAFTKWRYAVCFFCWCNLHFLFRLEGNKIYFKTWVFVVLYTIWWFHSPMFLKMVKWFCQLLCCCRRNHNHIWQVLMYARTIFYKINTTEPLNPEAAVL